MKLFALFVLARNKAHRGGEASGKRRSMQMRATVLRRTVAGFAWFACVIGCSGCLAPSRLPADEAFALSASALTGSDRYSYSGEYTVTGADGSVAIKGRYSGEVAGHRTAALRWEGSSPPSSEGGSHPMFLAEAVQLQAAAIAYEPSSGNTVALKVALRPEAARARAAGLLRSRFEADNMDSLTATTVCQWTADRRTWFPKELKEETVMQYRVEGRWRTEKRISVTNFRRRADGAIINHEEGH